MSAVVPGHRGWLRWWWSRGQASRAFGPPGAAATVTAAFQIVVLLGSAGGLACTGGEVGGSPEAAVRQLIAAARAGDGVAVYRRLGPRTRGRIDAILASAHKSGGARLLRPADLVTVGWVPPAWEASNVHEQNRNGDEADVEVVSAAGDRQTVRVVRENKRWFVELPLR